MHWVREPAGKTGCLEWRPAQGTVWVQWLEESLNGKAQHAKQRLSCLGPRDRLSGQTWTQLADQLQLCSGCQVLPLSPTPIPSIPARGLALIQLQLQPASQTIGYMCITQDSVKMEVLIQEVGAGGTGGEGGWYCISDKLPGNGSPTGLKNKDLEINVGRVEWSVSLCTGGFLSGPAP